VFRDHSSSTGRAERGSPYGPALRVAQLLNKEPSPVKRYPQRGRITRLTTPGASPCARNCRQASRFGHLRKAALSPVANVTGRREPARGKPSPRIRTRAGIRPVVPKALGVGPFCRSDPVGPARRRRGLDDRPRQPRGPLVSPAWRGVPGLLDQNRHRLSDATPGKPVTGSQPADTALRTWSACRAVRIQRQGPRRTARDGKRAASVPGGGPRVYPQNYHERGKGRGGNRFVMKHPAEPVLLAPRRGVKRGPCPADCHHHTDQP
jgi:hypothetical protein